MTPRPSPSRARRHWRKRKTNIAGSLYVAMTRAADLLIVVRRRRRTPTAGRLLVQSRARAAAAVSRCRRRRRRQGFPLSQAGGAEIANRAPATPAAIQDWPHRYSAVAVAAGAATGAASAAAVALVGVRGGDRRALAHAAGSAIERRWALARGRIVHRLMQSLPDIPPARPQGRDRAIS